MLKRIGIWLLKMFLGGLFKNIQNKEAEKAKDEKDRAVIAAKTAEEAKDVEVEILEKQIEAERTFKARELPDDDLFGFKDFNKGN